MAKKRFDAEAGADYYETPRHEERAVTVAQVTKSAFDSMEIPLEDWLADGNGPLAYALMVTENVIGDERVMFGERHMAWVYRVALAHAENLSGVQE